LIFVLDSFHVNALGFGVSGSHQVCHDRNKPNFAQGAGVLHNGTVHNALCVKPMSTRVEVGVLILQLVQTDGTAVINFLGLGFPFQGLHLPPFSSGEPIAQRHIHILVLTTAHNREPSAEK